MPPSAQPASAQLAAITARLAGARSLDAIVELLRESARTLIGADGIAVVLRNGDRCHYVAEDAVGPLWTGQLFPADACVSGHAMREKRLIIIPDITLDPRVPQAAYAPTFVRSMAMAPIGKETPIAALGAYWATPGAPGEDQIATLAALAEVAAAAIENMRLVSVAEESEAKLRAVLDAVTECYYALDRDWRVIEFSKSAEDYFRLRRDDVLGKNLWDLFPAGRGQPYETLCRNAMEKQERGRLEAPSDFRPGRTVEVRAGPVEAGITIVVTDITERRAAEAELRQQTAQLQAVLDAAPAAIWIARDAAGNDIVGNRFARELLRMPAGANLSKSATDTEATLAHFRVLSAEGEELAAQDLPVQRAARGEAISAFEERIAFSDGAEIHLLGNAVPLHDSNGAASGAVAAFSDITHLKAAEQALRDLTRDLEIRVEAAVKEREAALSQLHEAQKTESLGQIAGGVAHDFNNLLSPILGGLELLRRRGPNDPRAPMLIDGALQSAERARILVQRMLAFARRQPLQRTAVDPTQLLAGLSGLLSSSVGPRIRINVDTAPNLPRIFADANQLELALLNLVLNARDAMPDGGSITITANLASLSEGERVRIEVSDTGVGMDEATLKRAIEPFFSTKGVGKGVGLGLSMAHGLAAQLGGALELLSTPHVGTRVALLLPLAPAGEGARAPQQAQPAPRKAGAVLLVDDEDLVRLSTRAMLEEIGFTVVEAASAREALAVIDAGQTFDWMITDHMMPGMTGADLAREVKSRAPAPNVLIISGYADVDAIAPDLPRLAKPFRQDELALMLAASS